MEIPREGSDQLSPLQRAYYLIQKLKAELAERPRPPEGDAIAVIGMACRWPGGIASPQELWELLERGGDAITEVPPTRWDAEAWYAPQARLPGKMSSKWGGFCQKAEQFDPAFFGISPLEAYHMDPQHRLLLMVAWEALENAGILPADLDGSDAGVFIGQGATDYFSLLLQALQPEEIGPYLGTGGSGSGASGRLAFHLGCQGPALTIDTACSSSLVAVATACQNLRDGSCSLAIAGGVNMILSPEVQVGLSQAGMLAPDGRCKTFDASADGYVRAEGCAVVILKPLQAALRDGNPILAVVAGAAVVQDGNSGGLTVPNRQAQERLIRKALQGAGITGQDLAYIEAHGTGTSLGDPIEADAWTAVLQSQGRSQPLPIGSIKTNIGHAESAAGIAGLLKGILVLQHHRIPPSLHFSRPNPHIRWEETMLHVPTQPMDLAPTAERHHVAVSSFGFTGTLAQVILSSPPATVASTSPDRSHALLKLSARDPLALAALVSQWRRMLRQHPASLAALSLAANTSRQDEPYRAAFVAADVAGLAAQLDQWRPGSSSTSTEPRIALLFTGQGAQYAGMARQLYEDSAIFREQMDACEAIYADLTGGDSLLIHIYGDADPQAIHQTAITQPALFAVSWSLWRLWSAWGLRPAAVMGHSIGEYVAAAAAGVFSLRVAMALVVARGRGMQSLPQVGAMASVFADASTVADLCQGLEDRISVAGYNAPEQVVVSGEEAAVSEVLRRSVARNVRAVRLQVSHAFHSRLMEPMLPQFQEEVSRVTAQAPRIPLVSNVTADWITESMVADPGYWARHLRLPVRFHESLARMQDAGCTHFLEIGPGTTLMSLAQQTLGGEAACLSSLARDKDNWKTIQETLARLYMDGMRVDWRAWGENRALHLDAIPNYPWQTQAYWIDAQRSLAFDKDRLLATHLYRELWKPLERVPAGASTPGVQPRCLLLSDQADAVQLQLAQSGCRCQSLPRKDFSPANLQAALSRLMGEGPLTVVHLWLLDEGESPIAVEAVLRDTLAMLQELARVSVPLRLLSCTAGAVSVAGEAVPHPLAASIWGAMSVVASEQPDWEVQMLDVDGDLPDALAGLVRTAILGPWNEQKVAARGGAWWKARLEQVEPAAALDASQEIALLPGAAYVLTGGTGALGRQVLGWLASVGATELMILAHSQPNPAVIAELQAMEPRVNLHYVSVDVADAEALRAALLRIHETGKRVRGIFHLAGRLRDRLLPEQRPDDLEAVMAPKLRGAWNLHQTSLELGWDLDHFVLFSSVSALFGTPGQYGYAAANAGLDALAAHRRALGLAGISIQWGPWADAGMAADARLAGGFRQVGLSPFAPEVGLSVLAMALRLPHVVVTAVNVDWQVFSTFLHRGSVSCFESLLDGYDPLRQAAEDFKKALAAAYDRDKPGLVRAFLELVVGHVLGHQGTLRLDPAKALTEQGFDSLLALRLGTRLNELLGTQLPPTFLYLHPRLPDIIERIQADMEPREGKQDDGPDADLEGAELRALLEQELQELR